MNTRQPTETPATVEPENQLEAAMKPTEFLGATEIDPQRLEAEHQVGTGSEPHPPATEAGILAAVQATRDEIATDNLTSERVLDLICRRSQSLTDAIGAVIEFLERNELVYRAASGSAVRSLGLRVHTHRSLSGLCFRTKEVMRCHDTETDDRVDKAACRWVGIRSMILVPVVQDEQAVAVLAVISPGVAAFGDRDVWALGLMANLLAEAHGAEPIPRGEGPAAGS